jgi:hypothetical protein
LEEEINGRPRSHRTDENVKNVQNLVDSVNRAYYVEIIKRLLEAVLKLWPNDWILHHDNAPAYKTLSVKQFLAQKSTTKMDHPH